MHMDLTSKRSGPLQTIVSNCYYLASSTCNGLLRRVTEIFVTSKPEDVLQGRLVQAKTYDEWEHLAAQLDDVLGNTVWRSTAKSSFYDYALIENRLREIQNSEGDISSLMYLLRSGLLRNLGGMCDPRLFARSYLGTKLLIEDYINEIVRKLEFIRNARSLDNSQKLEFFHDTRQSFGNTALLLQGGATFGLYHLGVVKALNEHRILPRIISGTSVGALIAALVCVHTEDELPRIFEKGGINLRAFSRKTLTGHLRRKITRFLKHGYLMDVKVLEDCVRSNVGDITFAEAYAKTKRVLNITVAPRRKYEVPRLLNYLTAPDVLVWSAACASAATMGLYESVELLAKDSYGNIVHWVPSATTWTDVACESDSPEVKLAEQFNVNHFILSQANPYIAPFLPKGPQGQRDSFTDKVRLFLSSEIRYRLNQLGHFGLIPQALQTLFEAKMQGHITVAPALNSRDFYELFSNPTHASINYWIHKGYSSTWPYLSLIKHRVIIEMTLNEAYFSLRELLQRSAEDIQTEADIKTRTKSIA